MHQGQHETAITLAVIAGGQGRRMGGPKVLLRVGDQSILAWLLAKLAWPGPTMLVTAPAVREAPGAELFDTHVVDPTDDQGPLRGLQTALEHTSTELTIAIPVDMPNLDREKLQWLAGQLRPEMLGIMCRNGNGDIEPFPCVLRRNAVATVVKRLASGRRSLHGLCEEPWIEAITVDWPPEIWANLNEPKDLGPFQLGPPPRMST
jgi:molybdopterin-guanine dinucleotide biosynthesis protein A